MYQHIRKENYLFLKYRNQIKYEFKLISICTWIFCSGIEQANVGTFRWGDVTKSSQLNKLDNNLYEVHVQDDIVLKVKRTQNKAGYILGVFLVQDDGLSAETTGILGK